jgi:hypothetical protein
MKKLKKNVYEGRKCGDAVRIFHPVPVNFFLLTYFYRDRGNQVVMLKGG